jgi:hypothetical protein
MSRTRTLYIDLKRLACRPEESNILLRLMMVCNDLSTANAKFTETQKGRARIEDDVEWATTVYFLRLQIGHLSEAMHIIKELRGRSELMALVGQCSQHAQDEFEKLSACLKGGRDFKAFESKLMRIRNTAAFHYDPKTVGRALASRAEAGTRRRSVTASNDIRLVRFGVADAVLDTIFGNLWISGGLDVDQALDAALGFGEGLFRALLEFSQDFIMRYVETNCAC